MELSFCDEVEVIAYVYMYFTYVSINNNQSCLDHLSVTLNNRHLVIDSRPTFFCFVVIQYNFKFQTPSHENCHSLSRNHEIKQLNFILNGQFVKKIIIRIIISSLELCRHSFIYTICSNTPHWYTFTPGTSSHIVFELIFSNFQGQFYNTKLY